MKAPLNPSTPKGKNCESCEVVLVFDSMDKNLSVAIMMKASCIEHYFPVALFAFQYFGECFPEFFSIAVSLPLQK